MISENNKARIMNTLFKVKLLALVEQLAALLKRNFPYAFLSGGGGGEGGISDNCPSEFLLAGSSERQGFVSNTRKASQDHKETILCALQPGFSEKKKNLFNVEDMLQ